MKILDKKMYWAGCVIVVGTSISSYVLITQGDSFGWFGFVGASLVAGILIYETS